MSRVIFGYFGGVALVVAAISLGAWLTSAPGAQGACAQACSRTGMHRFEVVHHTADVDTPICECNPPAENGGAR